VRVSPGDKVTFMATDKTHNAETIQGMLPAGAQAFAGKMSENLSVAFDKEGVYGIKCKPHYGMGMVALVILGGDSANLVEAKSVKHPGCGCFGARYRVGQGKIVRERRCPLAWSSITRQR
jgi:pseudoazurin